MKSVFSASTTHIISRTSRNALVGSRLVRNPSMSSFFTSTLRNRSNRSSRTSFAVCAFPVQATAQFLERMTAFYLTLWRRRSPVPESLMEMTKSPIRNDVSSILNPAIIVMAVSPGWPRHTT